VNFLDLTLPTLAENLALDEALLLECEVGTGAEVLRLWEWPRPAVVLGAGGVLADDVEEAACGADEVPIGRRSSGGGTVLLGARCLIYSAVLAYRRAPELAQVGSSYCHILGLLCRSLGVADLGCAGTSDLAIQGRKVSGNSQQRKRDHLLHHGTLLYGFDRALVGRYLRQPARQPEYRQRRDHAAFLTNLPLTREALSTALRTGFEAAEEMTAWPRDRVAALVAEKYGQSAWIRRR
jgi:lipoate-protein ligase A